MVEDTTRLTIASLLFVLGVVVGSTGFGQTPKAASWEHFHPAASQHTALLNLERPDVLDHLQVSAGLFTHFVDDPVQELSADGTEVESRLVDNQLKTEIGGAIGLFDFLQLNVVVPVVPHQTGEGLSAVGGSSSATGAYVSEIRTSVDIPLIRPGDNGGFGVGLSGRAFIPSGASASFNADSTVHGGPNLSAIWRTQSNYELLGNVGFEFRARNQLRNYLAGHAVHWGFGGVAPLGADGRLAALANVFGKATVAARPGRETTEQFGASRDPTELLGGLRYDFNDQLRLQGGGGAGLTGGVGSPDFRLFASLHFRTASQRDETPAEVEPEPEPEPEPSAEPEAEPSDRDGDGIVDADDDCPDEPETFNAVDDEDGCPDPKEALVKITRLQIRFAERIQFETDESEIHAEDSAVLDEVAELLAEYPELTKIRVEGHADARGTDDYNQKLSERRSQAVIQYLTDAGVDSDRLEPAGYGEKRPVGDNRTSEGQWTNRRVEFQILEVEGQSVKDEESIEFERIVD